MTAHPSIQDPDDYSDEDMMAFAERLFSPATPTAELARICMLLAHLPTEAAQQLLRRFRASGRAAEVGWLECALEEGAFHLMAPQNDLEEREFLTLKVVEEIDDELVELAIKRDERDLERRKIEVRYEGIKALVATGHLDPDEAAGFDHRLAELQWEIDEIDKGIDTKEVLAKHLKDSITTPRYKNADPSVIRHIHLH